MGFYRHWLFPRLCDFTMRTPVLAAQRSELLRQASGEILEIGFGTGLNLRYYPDPIKTISALDVNPGMTSLAQKRIMQANFKVNFQVLNGEQLPMPKHSFDCVVSTFTLCSIEHLSTALGEIYRVLKPGGKFIFLEHGLADNRKIQLWQNRLNPIQKKLADGCHLNRDIEQIVASLPWQSIVVKRFCLEELPQVFASLYQGVAIK